jgi:hypothetical protein
MSLNQWETLLDEAAQMCGSQAALALRLDVNPAIVSLSKQGKGRLTEGHLGRLAELLECDASELWELQEVANMPRRNPFKKQLSQALGAFFLVNLSACNIGTFVSESSTYVSDRSSRALHIVGVSDVCTSDSSQLDGQLA